MHSILFHFSRKKLWVHILLGIVIFTCGMIVGGGMTVRYIWRHFDNSLLHTDFAAEHITRRLRSLLDLTDQQTLEVHSILEDSIGQLHGIRNRIQPEVQAELLAARERIAAVLQPEQRKEWYKRFDHLYNFWMSSKLNNAIPSATEEAVSP